MRIKDTAGSHNDGQVPVDKFELLRKGAVKGDV